jgi:AcrR family transcriptional regulator
MAENGSKRSEKTREIARAALAAFTQKGFQGTRLENIAAGAGIGKSTIYEYFKNKEELFRAAVQEAAEQWFDLIAQIAGQTQEPIDRLKRIAHAYMAFGDYPAIASQRFYFDILMQTIMEGGVFYQRRHFIHALHRKLIARIDDILLAGVSGGRLKASIAGDAHKIAVTYLSFLDGLTLYALSGGDHIDVRSQIDFFIRNLAPLLQTESPGSDLERLAG